MMNINYNGKENRSLILNKPKNDENVQNNNNGNDNMVIYLTEEKAVKRMPDNWGIGATAENLEILYEKFGEANVKVVNKKVQFASRRY